MARKIIRYTPEQLSWIEANQHGISRAELAKKFTDHFGIEVTWSQMRTICCNKGWKNGIDTRFKKGLVPYFKGTKGIKRATSASFKKGNVPVNKKDIDSERKHSAGYTLVKVAEPDVYDLKQRVVWEQHHGKIPDGYCIRFIDNDKDNLDIDNLIMIPKAVNAVVNLRYNANTESRLLNKVSIKSAHLAHKLRKVING